MNKVKLLFKKNIKGFIALFSLLVVLFAYNTTTFAYTISTYPYPYPDYYTDYSYQYNGSGQPFYAPNFYGNWITSYRIVDNRQFIGNFGDHQIQGIVFTWNFTREIEYMNEVSGYYNLKFHVSKSQYNSPMPDVVKWRVANDALVNPDDWSEGYVFMSDWFPVSRFEDDTKYWRSYYVDNFFFDDWVDILAPNITTFRIQICLEWYNGVNTSNIVDLSNWIDHATLDNMELPIPVIPSLPEQDIYPDNYNDKFTGAGQESYDNLENSLLNDSRTGISAAESMLQTALNSFARLGAAFGFVGDFMNNLTADNPLATLLVFSISLGVFGFLLNAFSGIISSARSSAKNRSNKKGSE